MRILGAIKVPAKIEYLPRCMNLASSCAKKQGFDENSINNLELATEEALVNIFNYAYRDGAGDVEVCCMLDYDKIFIIEISDSGTAFNILNTRDPDCSLDIDNRRIGGLGIFMIKTFMDNVEYRRESGKNILTFRMIKTIDH